MIITLEIDQVTLDPRCHPREMLDPAIVMEYARAMADGHTLPPVTVFTDNETHWLADGFHRVAAARQVGKTTIDAEVKAGDIRATILHAVGANAEHGYRRSEADRLRCVDVLLRDPEWCLWSDCTIARHCSVPHSVVAGARRSQLDDGGKSEWNLDGGAATAAIQRTAQPVQREWLRRLGVPDPMPAMPEAAYQEFKASIAEGGVRIPVLVDQFGDVIDGIHRIRAWAELRAEGANVPDYPRVVKHFESDEERMDAFVAFNMIGRADPEVAIDSRWVAAFGYRYPTVIRTFKIAAPGQPPRDPSAEARGRSRDDSKA